jgi:hypothetical protein
MSRSDSRFAPIGAFDADAETVSGLSSPASPAFPCASSGLRFDRAAASWSVVYSASDFGWEFEDPCRGGRTILLRNAVAQDGQFFEVRLVSVGAFVFSHISSVFVSRTVASVGKSCFGNCCDLQFVAFEAHSVLCAIGPFAFSLCESLQSIAIPPSVCLLGSYCFSTCRSLGSVTFEAPFRLATMEEGAFLLCESLNRLFIPASVTAIDELAFGGSGIRSIELEEGSISFRVENELLVDFEGWSLIWRIGSPESIRIPSSIEELRPFCCAEKANLRTVGFESDSNLRSIGESGFADCQALESICIPSSVEVLPDRCFHACRSLRAVTFGAESKLRLIERGAFGWCESLESICIPSSVEVLRKGCLRTCPSLRTVTFGAESKLRLIERGAFKGCESLELVSVPASAEVIDRQRFTFVSPQ